MDFVLYDIRLYVKLGNMLWSTSPQCQPPKLKKIKAYLLYLIWLQLKGQGQGQSRCEKHVQPWKEAHTRWLKHKDPKNKVLKKIEWINEWMKKEEVARQSAGVFFGGKSQKKMKFICKVGIV